MICITTTCASQPHRFCNYLAACTDASSKPSQPPQTPNAGYLSFNLATQQQQQQKKNGFCVVFAFTTIYFLLQFAKFHPVGGAQVTYLNSRCKKLTKPVLWPSFRVVLEKSQGTRKHDKCLGCYQSLGGRMRPFKDLIE